MGWFLFWALVALGSLGLGFAKGDLSYVWVLGSDRLLGFRLPAHFLALAAALFFLVRALLRRRTGR